MTARIVTGDLPRDLAQTFRREHLVAVDTETTGLDWRRDSLELCQLFTPATGAVLIRRSDAYPENLLSLLRDRLITKVFHFAPFDLRFLEATWRAQTGPVYCTKAASKLLNPQLPAREHSLGPLLERHFSLHLDKGSVRVSDWGASELSPEQVAYAAADVLNLLRLVDQQSSELRARGLQADFELICSYMPLDARLEVAGYPNPLIY
ncbi:hypothetical protein PCC79_16510 [Propioniciclava soli]|uniref:3'-5' exonuclease domain-containing protein n=1 Tax=Propioniciclava soli TaxID=2775081 RepID=A0ABZ3C6U5_9ACTN